MNFTVGLVINKKSCGVAASDATHMWKLHLTTLFYKSLGSAMAAVWSAKYFTNKIVKYLAKQIKKN